MGDDDRIGGARGGNKPSVKQVYAIAAALCERLGEQFPQSRPEASELIERLRDENGDPRAGLRGTVAEEKEMSLGNMA